MARSKKKNNKKRKSEDFTVKLMCCVNSRYCNTINDTIILRKFVEEAYRLYELRQLAPDIATSIICNINSRFIQIDADKRSRSRYSY